MSGISRCPLDKKVAFKGKCDQTKCPFNTSLTANGCWHGEDLTAVNFSRHKQLSNQQVRHLREYRKLVETRVRRVGTLIHYAIFTAELPAGPQGGSQTPSGRIKTLWERVRSSELWRQPELKFVNAGIFARMHDESNYEAFLEEYGLEMIAPLDELLAEFPGDC